MNLTLRTLLAWLDDTLPPNEVREIGKQVEESPFAKDLEEKIKRVTRQRRLTVPDGTGPDAVDANIVASYLDNELDSERVVEYEKKCLTSGVHLAEVASVHQILSLIGQKAKVPVDARLRMYNLVKGRESIAAKRRRPLKSDQPALVSEPVQPWVAPPPPRRPWLERFGPLGAVVVLMAALCWSAWKSLTPPVPSPAETLALNAAVVEQAPAPPAPVVAANAKEAVPAPAGAAAPEPPPAKPEAGAETETTEPKPDESEGKAKAKLPSGSVGQVSKTTGVLLRYNSDQLSNEGRQWVRIEPKTALRNQDRLLNLPPFRTTLELGATQVEMVGECELWALSASPKQAARFNLAQGRAVVHGTNPATPFEVQFAGRTLILTPPAGGVVGLERLNRPEAGAPAAPSAGIRIIATEGTTELKVDSAEETLTGPGAVTFRLPGRWTDRSTEPAPAWVTETAPPPFDAQVGDQFLKNFRPAHSVVSSLVEALDDESKDVRRLAISALRAMGDVSYLVTSSVLSKKEDQPTRRAAIAALRTYLAQGADSVQVLRKELVQEFGPEDAAKVEKLLNGFTPKEAKDEATYASLVQDLASTDERLVAIRELALDNLQTLTGRDDLGYNPDKPDGKGLKAWKDLLRDNELHPPATSKAKK